MDDEAARIRERLFRVIAPRGLLTISLATLTALNK
jgi:hypothetical protein